MKYSIEKEETSETMMNQSFALINTDIKDPIDTKRKSFTYNTSEVLVNGIKSEVEHVEMNPWAVHEVSELKLEKVIK